MGGTKRGWSRRKVALWAGGSLLGLFVLLQLVPYG